MDILSETLKSLRISGSVLFREEYVAPWAVAIPSAAKLKMLLGIKTGVQVAVFHLVEFGHCEVRLENGGKAVIEAGEMSICFSGAAHRVAQGQKSKALPVEALLKSGGNIFRPGSEGRGSEGRTRDAVLTCGGFLLNDTALNPLFAALPPLLHTSVNRGGEFHNLSGVARLIAQEMERQPLAGNYIVERLLEVLCAEAIRSHIEATPAAGWLGAIKDPVVGRAMAGIHATPGEDWSVQRLAKSVALSPSRFAARFTATLGESPMAYVAKWRMNVACRLLSGSQQSVAQIAADVGYQNLPAFNRAFKKHVGLPPAAWRAQA